MAIILPSGFNITNVDPIDSRFSVANQAARLGFSAANVYEGLPVYQQDTNETYILIDTGSYNSTAGWQLLGSNLTGSLATTGSNSFIGNQIITGNLTINGTASINYLNVSYESASIIYSSGSNQFGDATNDTQTLIGTVIVSGSQQITGSLNVTQGITGSLFGTASRANTASYYAETDPVFIAKSGSFATTGSNTFKGNQTISGSIYLKSGSVIDSIGADIFIKAGVGNNAGVALYNNTSTQYLAVDDTGSYANKFTVADRLTVSGLTTTQNQIVSGSITFAGGSKITNEYDYPSIDIIAGIGGYVELLSNNQSSSVILTNENVVIATSGGNWIFGEDGTTSYPANVIAASFTGSLFGTASFATTAASILGGKATHIPYFITDTTLATSSLYQSGSSTVIINQDNATTANPEALYVWQPSSTSINVISGKGNLNNYLQLNIQNTNQGVSASSDVVATANNGTETTNYIDMGINSENYSQNYIGAANDAYLYSTGNDLHIGNATPNKPLQFFVGGTDVDIYNKLQLNPNNQHIMSGSLEISGSVNVRSRLTSSGLLTNGNNTILGNTTMSGSSTIQGTTTMTGSLLVSGSTTQRGNNTLLGNTTLSGSIIISGSENLSIPTIQIYGDTQHTGVVRFNSIARSIDTSISASYIYVSGSTNDLYFSQNGSGYANTTRLRWLEGNLYTGLLNGGLITTQSSTVYQVGSGSGVVVNLNASYNNNPYPTVTYVTWANLSSSIASLSASYDQQFVSVQSNGTIFAQGTPYGNGEYDTLIPIGIVIHQNRSTINAVQTFPSVAYGFKQRTDDFIKAFGPVKISGYTLSPSGSSTGSLVLSGGTAYVDGRNYIVDPNSPSYVTELNGITTSKIYRYYQSGSADWKYNTNAGVGYATIDPTQYSNNGTLTALSNNNKWSIQRVYYFPNSATKAFYIYYGNAEYDTKADAISALTTEPFNEAPNTAANALFIGYMLLQKIADFTSTATYEFRAAGLFRGSGTAIGGGSATSATLSGLSDVSITSPANNNLLAYNSSTAKWENVASITANVTGNLTGTATTASYISPTFISASAAASGFGSGGGGGVGDYVASSWTGSTTSQFAGTASFATTAQNVLGSIASAATASYATSFVIGTGGTLTLDGNLIDSSTVSSTIVGSNNLYQQATGSYTSAHGKYTIYKGANSRAGEFVASWNGTTTSYYDNSTVDIGDTADIVFQSSIVTSQIQINAVSATSGWTVKMLVTYL